MQALSNCMYVIHLGIMHDSMTHLGFDPHDDARNDPHDDPHDDKHLPLIRSASLQRRNARCASCPGSCMHLCRWNMGS